MSRTHDLYTGRSGQLAVLAELLRRGYNAAIPEVDVGDDIFTIRDADGKLWRIQVKSAMGKGVRSISGTFKVPLVQLRRRMIPDLFYVFTVHHGGFWRDFLILKRNDLRREHERYRIGSVADGHAVIRIAYSQHDVMCKGRSLQQYREAWSPWQLIQH